MLLADSFTPTYESAIARDPWVLVAPYVRSRNDLRSSALVCRAWNNIFMSLLWCDPTVYTSYCSFAYFLRRLPSVRLSTRIFVRTLRLSWQDPSIVDCFVTWLRALVLLLPNLQSLYVSGLACLDHKALTSLSSLRQVYYDDHDGKEEEDKLESSLRLLEAQNAENLTSPALCQVVSSFPRLVYLDLSGSSPSRNPTFLAGLAQLRHLRLLRLRGVRLEDADLEVLAPAIRRRIRFLDISLNRVTDRGLCFLEKHCFNNDDDPHPTFHETSDRHFEWSASGSPFANILTSHSLFSERFEKHLREQLSEPLTGRSDFSDIPWTGISHIVLGENSISPEALGRLISSKDLCYLDAGSSSLPPGLLKHPGAKSLRFLRVHHSAVTQNRDSRTFMEVDSTLSNTSECPSIRSLLEKRPLLDESGSGPALLHPSWVPSLETLILTDVPKRLRQSSALIEELIRYITACGDESYLATLARCTTRPENGVASLLHPSFALRRIVLEMKTHNASIKVSATEDEDSENLWKEASSDFSFFSNEAVARYHCIEEAVTETTIDTVARLAAFRKAKREEYSQACKAGSFPYVRGYWNGEVTVVHG